MLSPSLKKVIFASIISIISSVAQANLVTSIKPLGFIASSIAEGVTDIEIIVPPGASPHDYNLKPSDIQKVKGTELMLWIGEDIDSFLHKTVDLVDPEKVITLANLTEIRTLLTKSENEHNHDHNHDHKDSHSHKAENKNKHSDHHNEFGINWHIWYSPEISKIIAKEIAGKLIQQYPDKKVHIEQNLADFNRSLTEYSEKIKTQLAPVVNKGFYVFHDAYSYFNDAYGLKQTGYFTINPLVAPGAKTLAMIKQEIAEHKVSCLFAEPQFTPKVIESLSKSSGAHIGRLDPMGDNIKLGKHAYVDFLQFTANSYMDCLNK